MEGDSPMMEGDSLPSIDSIEGDSLHSPNPLSMLSLESDFSTPQLGPGPDEEQAADLEHGQQLGWRDASTGVSGLFI